MCAHSVEGCDVVDWILCGVYGSRGWKRRRGELAEEGVIWGEVANDNAAWEFPCHHLCVHGSRLCPIRVVKPRRPVVTLL